MRLITRNGNDWTAQAAGAGSRRSQALELPDGWLDGEIVVLERRAAVPDFNALQNAFDSARTGDIVYFVFDLPFSTATTCASVPLRRAPRACCSACCERKPQRPRALQRRRSTRQPQRRARSRPASWGWKA